MGTSISDVCEKFQIYLADVIVNEKHRPEVAQLLSDIAEKIRSNSSSPLQALETVLGDSSVKFFNRFECQTGLYGILNRLSKSPSSDFIWPGTNGRFLTTVFFCSEFTLENICSGVKFFGKNVCGEFYLRQLIFADRWKNRKKLNPHKFCATW